MKHWRSFLVLLTTFVVLILFDAKIIGMRGLFSYISLSTIYAALLQVKIANFKPGVPLVVSNNAIRNIDTSVAYRIIANTSFTEANTNYEVFVLRDAVSGGMPIALMSDDVRVCGDEDSDRGNIGKLCSVAFGSHLVRDDDIEDAAYKKHMTVCLLS